jgi:hypothetical protein
LFDLCHFLGFGRRLPGGRSLMRTLPQRWLLRKLGTSDGFSFSLLHYFGWISFSLIDRRLLWPCAPVEISFFNAEFALIAAIVSPVLGDNLGLRNHRHSNILLAIGAATLFRNRAHICGSLCGNCTAFASAGVLAEPSEASERNCQPTRWLCWLQYFARKY